jgi:hypothetical protein
MKTFLFASTAVLLLSGSPANADDPLIPNDNDHMQALSTALERNAAASTTRYGAQIVTAASQVVVAASTDAAGPVSPGFLLHADQNDGKRVENQYAR